MIKIGDAVLSVKPDMNPLEKGLDSARVFAQKAGKKIGDALAAGLDKGVKKIAEVGKQMQDLGKKSSVAGAAITAAFVLVGGAALKTTADLDAASTKMAAALGKPREQAQEFRKDIKEIFNQNLGDSIEDVGQAATSVVAALETVGAAVDSNLRRKVTEGALTLRKAFGLDIPKTMDAATALMDNFGLTAEQSLDFVAAGLQRGLDKSGDFLDSIREYSVQFAGAGADAGAFFSVLETGLQSGVLGTDKAADLFKEFRIRIQDESETTRNALARIGLDAGDIEKQIASGQLTVAKAFDLVQDRLRKTQNPVDRFNAGVALFGTQFEDLGEKAALALDTTQTKVEDLAGATDDLQEQYKTIGGLAAGAFREISTALDPIGKQIRDVLLAHWDQFKAIVQDVAALAPQLGAAFGDTLQMAIGMIMPLVQATIDWIKAHTELTARIVAFAGVLGVLLTFLAPVLLGFSQLAIMAPKVVSGLGLMKSGTLAVTGGIKTLLPFIVANGPLIVALGAVALAVIAVGREWMKLRDAQKQLEESTQGVENKLREFAERLGDDVAEQLARIEGLDRKIQFINAKNQEAIRNKFAALIEQIKGAEATAAEVDRAIAASLADALTSEMDAATAALVALNTETLAEVQGLLQKSSGEVEAFIEDIRAKSQDALGGAGAEIVQATAAQVESIRQSAAEFAQAQTEFTNATVEEFNKRQQKQEQFFAFSNEGFQQNAKTGVEASKAITNADVEANKTRTELVGDHTENVQQSADAQIKLWSNIGRAAAGAAETAERSWLQRLDAILIKAGEVQKKIAEAFQQSRELASFGGGSNRASSDDFPEPVPEFRHGGTQRRDGLAFLHGNRTPELAYLPAGTRILNPEQTREAMAPSASAPVFNFDFRNTNFGNMTPEEAEGAMTRSINKVLRDRGIHRMIRT